MEKLIIIAFDYTLPRGMSYVEGWRAIETGQSFSTNCLDFFGFDMLEKGYDVKVLKHDGSYILLSELLENTGEYTSKEIRKAHNVHKMLCAGGFTFKKGTPPSVAEVQDKGMMEVAEWFLGLNANEIKIGDDDRLDSPYGRIGCPGEIGLKEFDDCTGTPCKKCWISAHKTAHLKK